MDRGRLADELAAVAVGVGPLVGEPHGDLAGLLHLLQGVAGGGAGVGGGAGGQQVRHGHRTSQQQGGLEQASTGQCGRAHLVNPKRSLCGAATGAAGPVRACRTVGAQPSVRLAHEPKGAKPPNRSPPYPVEPRKTVVPCQTPCRPSGTAVTQPL